MALDFKHASLVEGVRFTAQVGVPNVVQGLFKKRPGVVSTVGRLPADALAYRLVAGLAEKYGPDPFWVRVGGDEALLLTHRTTSTRCSAAAPRRSPRTRTPSARA